MSINNEDITKMQAPPGVDKNDGDVEKRRSKGAATKATNTVMHKLGMLEMVAFRVADHLRDGSYTNKHLRWLL